MWCFPLLSTTDNLTSAGLLSNLHHRVQTVWSPERVRKEYFEGGGAEDVMATYGRDRQFVHSGPWKETESINAEKERNSVP